jgi:hypothetical protein
VEANAVSPMRMERIAGLLPYTVDGSIIGRQGIHLYLAGDEEDVERVAGLFAGSDVQAFSLGPRIGAASALKMAFGGWNKIGIALIAQAHAIARAYGPTRSRPRASRPVEWSDSRRAHGAGHRRWRKSPTPAPSSA